MRSYLTAIALAVCDLRPWAESTAHPVLQRWQCQRSVVFSVFSSNLIRESERQLPAPYSVSPCKVSLGVIRLALNLECAQPRDVQRCVSLHRARVSPYSASANTGSTAASATTDQASEQGQYDPAPTAATVRRQRMTATRYRPAWFRPGSRHGHVTAATLKG